MVFPGGGVDDRDRNADIAWHGPDTVLVGRAVRRRRRPGRGAGLRGGPRDVRGVRRAVRRPGRRSGRHRRRRVGVPRRRARALAEQVRCRSASSCAARSLMLRADLLRPWANWVTPEGGAHPPLRHLLLRRGTARGPARRRREHRIRPGRLDHAAGRARRLRGAAQLPAAADVDAAGLAGRPHRRRGAGRRAPDRRRAAAPEHDATATGSSSSSTATATTPARNRAGRRRQP